jgi:2-polyprenyl-6-methoxyphenol hydroxylase-like FAD-dependent oxidoreductase
MEILRGFGVEDDVRAFSLDASPFMSISPVLAAPELMQMPLGFPTREQAARVSPTGPALSPQDHVEPILVARLRELGLTELRFGTELVALAQDEQAVTATILDRRTGATTEVRAGYVVGADGGRSSVRELVGIEIVGPSDLEHHASILFRADLWSILGKRRHGLYAVGGTPAPSIFAPMGPDDRWVLAKPMPLADAEALAADPTRAIALVREASGLADLDVDILAVMPLTFAAQVASRWRVGRVFLAGDAAHRMPPFGGRGMNTAIADAHNLAWKLALVVRREAAPSLLDTYEEERGPVGRANISLALSRYRDRQAESGLVLDLPEGVGLIGTPDGLVEDLGYVYASRGIVGPEDDADTDEGGVRPGARAPHAWLEVDGGPVSTIDLFGDRLVLLARGHGGRWRAAAHGLTAGPSFLSGLARLAPLAGSARSAGLEVTVVDESGAAQSSFGAAYGLEPGGAVLVRPDGHVAARWTCAPADHAAALARAVDVALGYGRFEPAPATSSGLVPVPEARRTSVVPMPAA